MLSKQQVRIIMMFVSSNSVSFIFRWYRNSNTKIHYDRWFSRFSLFTKHSYHAPYFFVNVLIFVPLYECRYECMHVQYCTIWFPLNHKLVFLVWPVLLHLMSSDDGWLLVVSLNGWMVCWLILYGGILFSCAIIVIIIVVVFFFAVVVH